MQLDPAGRTGVIAVQLVTKADVINESCRAHFYVDITNDATIPLPTGIQPQFDFVFASAGRVWNQVRNGHLNTVASFPGLSCEIKFIGNIRSHTAKLTAVEKDPAMVSDGVEMENGPLMG